METLWSIFLASLATLIVLWLGHTWARKRWGTLPPGPFPFPILGNLPHVMIAGGNRHRYFARLAKHYGPIFSLQLGSTPVIIVSSPSLARAVLQTHDKLFASRPSFVNARFLMGDEYGEKIVTLLPYADEWKELRKLYIDQLFSPRRMGEFHTDIVPHEIRRLIENQLVPASHAGDAVNLTACIGNLIEDIICRIVVRRRSENFFDESTTNIATHSSLSSLIHGLTDLLGAPLVSEFLPFLGFLDYHTKAAMRNWNSRFDSFMDHVISAREKDAVVEKDVARDILDVLLLPENKLSRGVIKALIMELFTAGSHALSATTDWAMSEVLSNPRVTQKLREELNMVVGRDRYVEFSHIACLPYLHAVVKETLRLHPPSPLMFPHMALDACQDVGGYAIPKGTRVFINVWAIAHDPEVWGDDHDKFSPERFFENGNTSKDLKGQHFELLPFGSGRRMCPGINLSLPILDITLANLLHAFDDWELVLPHGQSSLDMSDECGIVCRRVQHLIAVPRKKDIA